MIPIFTLLFWFVILGVVAYLIETYLPMPAPFKIVIRVIIVVAAIWLLLSFIGVPPLRLR